LSFYLLETKNVLTRREITVNVLGTLQSCGYETTLDGNTLTLKW
jgi:hypothetical protein